MKSRQSDAQQELTRASRLIVIERLSASITHEVAQPIGAALINAQTALRGLSAQSPDLENVRQALGRVVRDTNRASDIVNGIRALFKKEAPQREDLDINQAVVDTIAFTQDEILRHGVSVRTHLAKRLPLVRGDRVQLQQVVLNLVINAVGAMSAGGEGPRELRISTRKVGADGLLVRLRDSGPGLAPANIERVFEAFYTTKPNGLGIGLPISRSIIEAHGGRLWAAARVPRGAVFQFVLPLHGTAHRGARPGAAASGSKRGRPSRHSRSA